MFGIPDKEIKETLANADVTLKAVDDTLATAQQTLTELQALVARATVLVSTIERNGLAILLKAGPDA